MVGVARSLRRPSPGGGYEEDTSSALGIELPTQGFQLDFTYTVDLIQILETGVVNIPIAKEMNPTNISSALRFT